MNNRQNQLWIMDWFLSDLHLIPPVPDRFEHEGTIHARMGETMAPAKAPAWSRIQLALRRLEKRGWLEGGDHPDSPIPVWRLSPLLLHAFDQNLVRSSADLFGVGAH